MKKRRIVIGIVVLSVAMLLVLFFGKLPFNPHPIVRGFVDRIELKTYSHSGAEGETCAELSAEEVDRIVRLYNRAGYDSQITGEPCCATFWLDVHLKGGSVIHISQGTQTNMIVNRAIGGRYWVCSQTLVEYVLELVKTYGLVRD